jgi:uncharacterized protein YodC (DUF2158 family)
MADERFEAGETVRLKSGGPLMTVEQTGRGGMGSDRELVWCVWFEQVGKKQEMKRGTFPPATLRKDDGMPRIG